MNIDMDRAHRRVKLRDLETLMAVVEAGGIRRAAQRLHMSQPAVSKSIAALEEATGAPLLERSRRGISITPCGQALIRRSAAMFDEWKQGLRELERLADPEGGEIALACGESIGAGLVAAAIERMSRRHPRVRFRIDSGDMKVVLSHFLSQRLTDVAITRDPGAAGGPFEVEPLFHEQLLVVADKSSPWGSRRRMALDELAEARWILSPFETAEDSPVASAFRAIGMPLPQAHALSNSLNLRYALLATGRFVTMMPASMVRLGRIPPTLKVLPIDVGRWPAPTVIVRMPGRSLSPAVDIFLDTLRDLSKPLS